MKKSKLVLVSLLVLTALLVFVGCTGNGDTNDETSLENQAPEITNETDNQEATENTEDQASDPDTSISASAGDPVKGQAFYEDKGCSGCHAINGVGSTSASDLSNIGNKYADAESMKTYLVEDHPVSISGSEEDIANLVAYLLSLK